MGYPSSSHSRLNSGDTASPSSYSHSREATAVCPGSEVKVLCTWVEKSLPGRFFSVHLRKSARSNNSQNCSYRDRWLFVELCGKQLAQMKMKGLNSPGSVLPRLYVLSVIRRSTYSERTWMNSWLWQNCRLSLLADF